MRDLGIPKLLTWRWAPCAALVLGSLSFVGFVTLAIPERIDGLVEEAGKAGSLRLGNHLARTRTGTPESPKDFAGESANDAPAPGSPPSSLVTRVAQHSGNYPRRGFTPPLDRPAAPPAPPPAEVTPAEPPPVEAVPPPPTLTPPPAQEPEAPQPDVAQTAAPSPAPAPGAPATE